jgi:glutamate racemase
MIGIFDSGSGGLSILAQLRKTLPNQSFIYLGDHARAPYGERSGDEIYSFSGEMIQTLFDRGCSLVLLACNTSATIALRRLQEDWLLDHYPEKRVLGVHIPMVEALTGLKWNRDNPGTNDAAGRNVVVFATPATVASKTYQDEIQKRAPNTLICEQSCPGLVAAIEAGASDEVLADLIKGFVDAALKKSSNLPGAAILGCTHYPLVEDLFSAALPDETEIICQPSIVASSLAGYIARHPEFDIFDSSPSLMCFTTGDPEAITPLARVQGKMPKFEKLN